MNALTRLESFLESLVERSFARLFHARLQPVEIAKRLSREMEASRVVGVSSVLVPNFYEVALSQEDYATFAPIRASLEGEMAQYLLRFAREHNYSTTARPEVHLASDATLRPGRLLVSSQLTEAAPGTPVVSDAATGDPATGDPATGERTLGDEVATERLQPTRVMPQMDPAPQVSYVTAPGEAHLTLGDTTYPLAGDSVALGRGLENTIVLEDRRISRSHARLTNTQGHWSIRDEGSTNGTFVNGRMVSQHALKNGDRLSLGGLELVFHQRWEGP